MPSKQGDLAQLQDPLAQRLLQSTQPARMAYTWTDGSPRVVPIWFHWTGQEVVMAGPTDAPKVAALSADPRVALTIDEADWPYRVLLIRGTARVQTVDGVPAEYAAAAQRYLGPEQGQGWVNQVKQLSSNMTRIGVTPEWVAVLDFETRFPSAIARQMQAR